MNLEMIRTQIQVAGWKFKCRHPLGRKWSKLPRIDKFAYKLMALNGICLIVLFILYETSKSS